MEGRDGYLQELDSAFAVIFKSTCLATVHRPYPESTHGDFGMLFRNSGSMCRTFCYRLQCRPVRTCSAHVPENTPLLVHQGFGRIKLQDLTATQHEDAVVVKHCPQTVRDCDDNGSAKFFADRPLYLTNPHQSCTYLHR